MAKSIKNAAELFAEDCLSCCGLFSAAALED